MPLTRCERSHASKSFCAVLASRSKSLRCARSLAHGASAYFLFALFDLRYLKRREARVCVVVVHHYGDYRVRRSGSISGLIFNESKHRVATRLVGDRWTEDPVFLVKIQRVRLQFYLPFLR